VNWFQSNLALHEKHVAFYYPYLKINEIEIGASYAVAGIVNRLDKTAGIWSSPSGGTTKLSDSAIFPTVRLGNPETLQLNGMGVNCIRHFKSLGTVLWGSVTGVGLKHPNPYWKYIQMRRTLFYIKKSIVAGVSPLSQLSYYTGVEHDISAVVEPFLLDLFSRGAFMGKTVAEAYSLMCTAENNTVTISVGVALLTPTEQVMTTVVVVMMSPETSH